jgi:fructuronate reductase
VSAANPGRPLSRTSVPGTSELPPVRFVHLGLGAFHRAHQAWYTAHASDATQWGIAAFSGRSRLVAEQLAAQDGLFTVVERGADADRFEIISSIVRALPGGDTESFTEFLSAPDVAVLTLTITEAGYRFDANGLIDVGDPLVASDIETLRRGFATPGHPARLVASTPLGRVLVGLEARRRAGAPPLAIVPCDNLPDNGTLVRRAFETLAAVTSPELAAWLPVGASFVSTSVDRITPKTTAADLELVRTATGLRDDSAVVTEPFTDWVLCGDFPSGRPDWESAGARFVDDIVPWQMRKLWMLNGAHTLLAALGALRGHCFVSTAIADPVCREAVERFWDEAARQLHDVDTHAYRAALVERFANARIEHRLDQIGSDAATKVALRIVPVALRERAAGRSADGCASAVAAWVLAVRDRSSPAPRGLSSMSSVERLVEALHEELARDAEFCAGVSRAMRAILERLPGAQEASESTETERPGGVPREEAR